MLAARIKFGESHWRCLRQKHDHALDNCLEYRQLYPMPKHGNISSGRPVAQGTRDAPSCATGAVIAAWYRSRKLMGLANLLFRAARVRFSRVERRRQVTEREC